MPDSLITDEFLNGLFPPEKADEFFDALYGGAETGAFDISLRCAGFNKENDILVVEFVLTERPGKCMACNLTYGLPQVFERHPIINLKNIINSIEQKLSPNWKVLEWQIGSTQVIDSKVNTIPVFIKLEKA